MNKYKEANKKAWGIIAEEIYNSFKEEFAEYGTTLLEIQEEEIGNISGKTLIHLMCNTGADTISLARMGAKVTGVDFAPENISFAKKLATDFDIKDAMFFEADVLKIMKNHHEKYDIVYTTDGVLQWIPDLMLWAQNVRHLLKDDGFLYLMDMHPFLMTMDEDTMPELSIKYPYFSKEPEPDELTPSYASEAKKSVNYSWMYTIGDIINSLNNAGLHIEWFHEFDWLSWSMSDEHEEDENDLFYYPKLKGKLPFTFSLKATIR